MAACCDCDCCSLVPGLPLEIQQKIFSFLPADLQALTLEGHIIIKRDRTVSLSSGLTVGVFAVSGGCGQVIVICLQFYWQAGRGTLFWFLLGIMY